MRIVNCIVVYNSPTCTNPMYKVINITVKSGTDFTTLYWDMWEYGVTKFRYKTVREMAKAVLQILNENNFDVDRYSLASAEWINIDFVDVQSGEVSHHTLNQLT